MQLAMESQGCSVISATSNDLVHLPSSILTKGRSEESNDNFWISTGSFPQEVVIQLGAASSIKSVDIVSLGIRKIQLDKCDGPQANSWELVCAEEANDADGEVQRLSMDIPPRVTASYLRFRVSSGWSDCITIYNISIMGSPAEKRNDTVSRK